MNIMLQVQNSLHKLTNNWYDYEKICGYTGYEKTPSIYVNSDMIALIKTQKGSNKESCALIYTPYVHHAKFGKIC